MFQTTLASVTGSNAFITKMNPTGSALVYSTYLGGSGVDVGNALSLDQTTLDVYLTGSTDSTNFPTTAGAFQTTIKAIGSSAFVTKLQSDASGLIYSTVLGGSGGGDQALAIAHDSQGLANVTGIAASSDFPVTADAFQSSIAGAVDAFFATFDAAGSKLVYSTFIGGKAADVGNSIALDSSNNAYIGGKTSSSNFPTTAGVIQSTWGGAGDGFVGEFSASGSSPPATASLGAKPSRLNFGNVDATGSSKTKKIKLSNTGTTPAQVSDISASAPFAISGSGNTCTGQTIAPKKKCVFEVEFMPTAVGVVTGGSIEVTYNGSSPAVSLTGDGIAAVLKAPKSKSLGAAAAGAVGKPKTLKLSNKSVVGLTLGAAAIGGADSGSFQITDDQCSGSVLPAKGKCTIAVEFAPPGGSASGSQTATLALDFTYGSNNGSASTTLSGKVK